MDGQWLKEVLREDGRLYGVMAVRPSGFISAKSITRLNGSVMSRNKTYLKLGLGAHARCKLAQHIESVALLVR